MATPKLWSGIITDGKTSKVTGRKMLFYLPILKKGLSNDPVRLRYTDLHPELRGIFANVNYENYHKLWKALKKHAKNDFIFMRFVGGIIKTRTR